MDRPRTLTIENGPKAEPTFSATEMSRRLERLRAHMAREEIDAVLFTSFHNINYFTDFMYCAFGRAYGGSRRAFWGAVAGGFLGIFVGLPIPLVGPVLTAFLGTFLGALLVTLVETRSLAGSTRVGWGMVLARTASVGLKMGTGVAFLVWAVVLVVF